MRGRVRFRFQGVFIFDNQTEAGARWRPRGSVIVDIWRYFGMQKFCFEPAAEPSFEVRFQVDPPWQRGMLVAYVTLDLKRVLEMTIPTSYRDDRITLQLTTVRNRLHRFAEQFSLEASKV